jgi:SecD/SecF fusion protein
MFMLVYYLRAGVIADLCLLLNLILVLGAMSIFQATFTLPGLAGLVLTIGMAVDANVLIFERIREEKERGASQRMSIQNGFSKALSTIVDANVTTLITAVILYVIGSDAVRGFAVALFIGIVMSMFSVLVFGRLLFDMGEKLKLLGELKMLDLKKFIAGSRNDWNFLGVRKIAMVFSALLIVGGLAAFFSRGEDNYDIDFTGGTMVTFELEKEAAIEDVRKILEAKFGNITLERLTIEGEEGDVGRRYRMRTKLRDAEPEAGAEAQPTIQQMVGQAFEGKEVQPRRVTVEFGAPVKIELADSSTAEEPDDGSKPESEKTSTEPTIPFQGGHKIELAFSHEVKPTTAQLYFGNAIQEFELEGRPKYELTGELFEVKGTAGSGMEAGEKAGGKAYSKVELKVASTVPVADLQTALKSMQQHMADNPTFDEVNSFDSSIASEMRQDAVLAILASLIAIVFYIWIRFDKVTFGFAAVAALIHDVLVVLGLVAICSYLSNTPIAGVLMLSDFKINLPMIAAFLTIVGYSLNDTIVVFDRIREVRGKNPAMTVSMVNLSLNQTLSRTILTSLTTLLVVVILYIFGGEGIHGFAFCLVLGVVVGTYSTIYIATPVLLWLINRPGSEVGLATARANEEEAKRSGNQGPALES